MSNPIVEIHDTSFALAIEEALDKVKRELVTTPMDAIRSVGMRWNVDRTPTWDDAIYIMAYAWRLKCSGRPMTAARSIPQPLTKAERKPQRKRRSRAGEECAPVAPPKPPRPDLKCPVCRKPYDSGNIGVRICPECKARMRKDGPDLEEAYG